MSERAGGIVLAGFFTFVYVLGYILAKYERKKRKNDKEYDERQKLVQGQAYKLGFTSMWIMCLFVSFVRNYSKESLMEAELVLPCALLMAVFIIAVYMIWNDAFVGVNEKPWLTYAALIFVCLFSGAAAFYFSKYEPQSNTILGLAQVLVLAFILSCLTLLTTLARTIYLRIRDSE